MSIIHSLKQEKKEDKSKDLSSIKIQNYFAVIVPAVASYVAA